MKRSVTNLFFSLTITACICSFSIKTQAQETMIPDISYLFLEKLIATAKQNYPLVKQNKLREDISSLQVRNNQLDWLSPFNLIYFSQPNNGVNLSNPQLFSGFQVALNFNLGDLAQNPNNVRIARKQLDVSKQVSAQFDNNLELEVKTRYFTYIQHLNNVKLYTKSLEDAAGLLSDLKVRYERGEVTFQNYSEGLISFSTISQAKIESEAGLLIAKATIEELTVTKLEDIK